MIDDMAPTYTTPEISSAATGLTSGVAGIGVPVIPVADVRLCSSCGSLVYATLIDRHTKLHATLSLINISLG
jgi:hypothetical protein